MSPCRCWRGSVRRWRSVHVVVDACPDASVTRVGDRSLGVAATVLLNFDAAAEPHRPIHPMLPDRRRD